MGGAGVRGGFTAQTYVQDHGEALYRRSLAISELSFGKYISLTSQGNAPMLAIPVFPSRVHRHSAIYVRKDRGIRTAKDRRHD